MSNKKEEIRENLKDLLQDEGTNLPIAKVGDLPTFHSVDNFEYTSSKAKAIVKAKAMMNSVMKLYLSEEIIEENEYVKIKQKISTMQLATLINQMQQMEHTIETLMRTIDSGELSPRMFEVLGGLQKTMLEVMKHTTLHIMAAEENMKKLKHDIDIYSNTTTITNKKDDGVISRGSRDFMKGIQEEIQDVDFKDEEKDE